MDCLSAKELDAGFRLSSAALVRGTAVWLCVMELTGTGYLVFEVALVDPSGGWRYGKRFKCNLQLCF